MPSAEAGPDRKIRHEQTIMHKGTDRTASGKRDLGAILSIINLTDTV
jgi:hypothetical protein